MIGIDYFSNISSGKKQSPYFFICFGPSGIGKSTFASAAPRSIFMDVEGSTNNLNVNRFPVKVEDYNWDVINEILDQTIERKELPFDTLVFDSLDRMEEHCWAAVCKENGWKSIEDPGYGKGYVFALKKWQNFLHKLMKLRHRIHIILIAHSQIRTFTDPRQAAPYDRHEIKLHQKSAALLKEAVDAVLFATDDTVVLKSGSGPSKGRAVGTGKRILLTERRPAHDAKNRYGLPYELPLSWEDFDRAAREGNPEDPEKLEAEILALLSELEDEKARAAVKASLEKGKGNGPELARILNKLYVVLGED